MTALQEKDKHAQFNIEHQCLNVEYDRKASFQDGTLAIEYGDLDKAEKIFNEMIEHNREDYEAINKLGIVYAKKKDFMVAREYFEQALHINENYGPAFVNIGNTYKECEDNVKAKEYYELAIERDVKYDLSYYNLAIIYKASGDYSKYMKYMKEYKKMYKLFQNTEKATISRSFKDKKIYKGALVVFLIFIFLIYFT